MVDQSLSMNESTSGGVSKWTAVTSALETFLRQPSLAGVGVGIQFFGLPVGGKTCDKPCTSPSDCPGDTCVPVPSLGFSVCSQCLDSCTASDYETPEVEIGTLPGSQAQLISAINGHKPATLTPTSAALEGAVSHAQAWAKANPTHVSIVVFATDGDPSECELDQNKIDAIAAAGVNGSPKVLTFVIGVGSSFQALDGIASAGGTTKAFIVGTNGNVNKQFLNALNVIRGAANACQYEIPASTGDKPLDLGTVNLQYTPGGGQPQIIPKVSSSDACPSDGNAWYFDDNDAPTKILLCDGVCSDLQHDTTADVTVLIGCASVVK
jgi:hypothetical protein